MQIPVWPLEMHNSRPTFLNRNISKNNQNTATCSPLLKGARFQNTCKNGQKLPIFKDIKPDKKAKNTPKRAKVVKNINCDLFRYICDQK